MPAVYRDRIHSERWRGSAASWRTCGPVAIGDMCPDCHSHVAAGLERSAKTGGEGTVRGCGAASDGCEEAISVGVAEFWEVCKAFYQGFRREVEVGMGS